MRPAICNRKSVKSCASNSVGTALALACVVAVVSGCSAKGLDDSSFHRDTLRVALSSDIRTTEPGVLRDANTDDVLMHIVEPLFAYRENLEVAPLLVSSWRVSEDGKTYTMSLRDGVQFHNGTTATAQIVVWNIERYLDPGTRWICRSLFDGSRGLEIEQVVALGERAFQIELNQADGTFLHKLANLQCNMGIVHPDSVSAAGDWRVPIGTGPFQFVEWQRGQYVDLRRFDHYQPVLSPRDGLAGDRTAGFQYLRWVVVPEPAAARAGLLSGQLDVIYRLQVSDLFDLRSSTEVVVDEGTSIDWDVLLMQAETGRLRDRALRLAIAHAVDADQLAAIITDGISSGNHALTPPQSGYFRACMAQGYIFSEEIARRWLAQSSYNGEALKLTTNRRFSNMYENAIIIQHMLGRVGIRTELEVVEWGTQLDYYARGQYELMSFGYTGRTHPVLNYDAILGDKSKNPMYQWDDPASVGLLEEIARTDNVAVVDDLLCELHARMIDAVPMLNLFNQHTIDAYRSHVVGYSATAFNKPRFWGVRLDRSAAPARET
ncbi:MAG: ABC transporter substrate-binding protein [Pseudomonadota bacterium]